ncbi:exodeoxyribonuclease VII small subunit [Helicobacter sp. 11S03491-1]|uniref:exodeoxyribonuclease VII small subunit n=1 Tax=Helicobacter sp. 11S03491-1 TaxID=1476196 RepID=UPI000BA69C29|nr:exodeoxyribonuclease VII small subunit [Helicobacter sp. 11S03491-1]PAF41109.1 exodeoxyribonuclease VII small subunit [Helicobacter sp. 11S03491-1]
MEVVEEISFEKRIDKIKDILNKLNAQNLNLKEGLNLYKEGMTELKDAQKMLEDAQIQYQELQLHNFQDKE